MQRWLRRAMAGACVGMTVAGMACDKSKMMASSKGAGSSAAAAGGGRGSVHDLGVGPVTQQLLAALNWNMASTPKGYWDEQGIMNAATPPQYVAVMAAIPNPALATLSFATPQLVAVVDLDKPVAANNPVGLTNAAPNCVFLQKTGQGWVAGVSQGSSSACPAPSAMNVVVTSHVVTPNPPSAIPAVARIEVNDANHDVVLGVRCDAEWCNIGSPNDLALPPGPDGGPISKTIRGRHDRQALGKFAGGMMQPSGLIGTVIPDDDVNTRPMAYYSGPTFKRVAVITIEGSQADLDNSKYGTVATPKRWGMSLGKNVVGLRYDSTKNEWQAAILDSHNQVSHALKVVSRDTHPMAMIPATARWLWDPGDEIMWLPCSDGCCTVDAAM